MGIMDMRSMEAHRPLHLWSVCMEYFHVSVRTEVAQDNVQSLPAFPSLSAEIMHLLSAWLECGCAFANCKNGQVLMENIKAHSYSCQ